MAGWAGGEGRDGHECHQGMLEPHFHSKLPPGLFPAIPTSASAHDFFHSSGERLIISLLFPFRVGTLPKVYLFKNWELVGPGCFVKLDPYGLNSPFSAAFCL